MLTVVIHTVPVNALTNSNSFDQNKQKPDLTDEVLETKEFNESLFSFAVKSCKTIYKKGLSPFLCVVLF